LQLTNFLPVSCRLPGEEVCGRVRASLSIHESSNGAGNVTLLAVVSYAVLMFLLAYEYRYPVYTIQPVVKPV